mmetsp:Transcript_7821/g.12877  ORF Transcript_7821/g.12877 Transcript_7821/m.12877 type:complete len:121 (+) Transcript_7821:149-511(+)
MGSVRDQATRRKEVTSEKSFQAGCQRATTHMNKDHAKDNLTLVQVYGDLPSAISAELKSMNRMGMKFDCKLKDGSEESVEILYPGILIEASELRETVVKLTLQGRKEGEHQVDTQANESA